MSSFRISVFYLHRRAQPSCRARLVVPSCGIRNSGTDSYVRIPHDCGWSFLLRRNATTANREARLLASSVCFVSSTEQPCLVVPTAGEDDGVEHAQPAGRVRRRQEPPEGDGGGAQRELRPRVNSPACRTHPSFFIIVRFSLG
eukprot:8787706-Pyramimonas_sp.AAC.3